jgi:hypothetical protein
MLQSYNQFAMSQDPLTAVREGYFDSLWQGFYDFERYLIGDQYLTRLLSEVERRDKDLARYLKCVNICKVIANEPIGYLSKASIKIESNNEQAALWAQDFYKKRLRRLVPQLVKFQAVYAWGFIRLWTDTEGDSRGLKAQALPPVEGGNKRLEPRFEGEDPETLTSAIIHYTVSQQLFQNAPKLQKRRLEISRNSIRESHQADQGGFYGAVERENPWGVTTVTPVFNTGPSDLIDVMDVQDDLNKTWFDFRQARDMHGFPMLTTDAKDPKGIVVGPRRILYGSTYGRIEPGSLEQLLLAEDRIIERAAMLSSSMALLHSAGKGSNLSGEALRNLRTSFEAKIDGKAEALSEGIAQALTQAARMLARDPALYALENPMTSDRQAMPATALEEATFTVEITPTMPADANADRASIVAARAGGVYSQRAALVKLGETAEGAERIVRETIAESLAASANDSSAT